MSDDIIEIIIQNRFWGDLDGSKIFLTKPLYEFFNETKSKSGELLINLLRQGRLLKGLKHLIEAIFKNDPSNTIILTLETSEKNGSKYFIDYNDFKKKSYSRFYQFYRETGMKNANAYLCKKFPESFDCKDLKPETISEEKFERNFESRIEKFSKKKQNRKLLYDKTAAAIEELKKERKTLNNELAELEILKNTSNIAFFQGKLNELEERLKKKYSETKGNNSWQSWIYANNWLFGVKYQQSISKERVGFDNIPDFLFPTMDGFLDILEIKLPTHEIIEEDKSHRGSFKWSQKSIEAIGQVVNYLHEMEMNQLLIQDKIREKYDLDIYVIKPRAFILIGRSDGWHPNKIKALRKLNFSLHGIEILTYSDLFEKGQKIIEIYTGNINS